MKNTRESLLAERAAIVGGEVSITCEEDYRYFAARLKNIDAALAAGQIIPAPLPCRVEGCGIHGMYGDGRHDDGTLAYICHKHYNARIIERRIAAERRQTREEAIASAMENGRGWRAAEEYADSLAAYGRLSGA